MTKEMTNLHIAPTLPYLLQFNVRLPSPPPPLQVSVAVLIDNFVSSSMEMEQIERAAGQV